MHLLLTIKNVRVSMSYITIRKISKYQYWWAEVEKLNSDSESYGIDPTSIATLLDRGEKLDKIIRVPSSILANNNLS